MSSTAVLGCRCCGCVGIGHCGHTGVHWYCLRWEEKEICEIMSLRGEKK